MPPVYHSTKHLLDALVALASTCGSSLDVTTVGRTTDGWPLKLATIGTGETRVFLTFGIHGREYMTSEIAMNFLGRLCSQDDRSILDQVTYSIIPVLNPSGRSRTDNAVGALTGLSEMDCGNRRKNANLVDLNRNFDWDWDDDDASSSNEDSTSYRGRSANSEVETQVVDKVAGRVQPDMYIDIHTGTLAMYAPWNHNSSGTCATPPCTPQNDKGLAVLDRVQKNVSWTMASDAQAESLNPSPKETRSNGGEAPRAGVGGIISYLASGTASDFVYARHNPRYSFIWETYDEAARPWGKREGNASMDLLALNGRLPRGAIPRRMRADAARAARRRAARAAPSQHRRGAAAGVTSLVAQDPTGLSNSSQGDVGEMPGSVSAGAPSAVGPLDKTLTGYDKAKSMTTTPSQWKGDECFEYFNPVDDASLEHWVGAWTDALFVASKQLLADMRENRELRGDLRAWV